MSTQEERQDEHPDDITSMKQIAALYFDLNKFDQAKEWQKKVLAANPKDAEAAYTIGVIDWTLAYKNAIADLKRDAAAFHAMDRHGIPHDPHLRAKIRRMAAELTSTG